MSCPACSPGVCVHFIPDTKYSAVQVTMMCDEAVTARTREIVTYLQRLAPHWAALLDKEYLSDAIQPAMDPDGELDEWEAGTQRRGG